MSTNQINDHYVNPLDAFESYSIHYTMVATRTTKIAAEFAGYDDKSRAKALSAIDKVTYLGAAIPFGQSSNDIFLVLDTRRFSQFTVENLKYDVWVNGLHVGASQANLATDLEMTVLDTVGISFGNFMQWLMDTQLKTNFDGMVFMLQVIFVGHKPDGSTETVQSETIPMHLQKMSINLDYAKGSYVMEFMPNINFNTSKNAKLLTIYKANTYTSGNDNTLGSLVTNFEDRLNNVSSKFYNDVQEKVNKEFSGIVKSPIGRKVQYFISIPGNWNGFKLAGTNANNAAELLFAKKEAEDKVAREKAAQTGQVLSSNIGARQGAVITDVMNKIFKQVPEVARMGNFKTDAQADGFVTFYKYIVGITSDDSVMSVHINVIEFKVPNVAASAAAPKKVTSTESQFYKTETSSAGVVRRIPKNYIEWDYIFTGKNTAITNFDMKIEDFQFLLASVTRIGDSAISGVSDSSSAGTKPVDPNEPKNDELLFLRQFDPVILPMNTKEALDNFSRLKDFKGNSEENKQHIKEAQQYTKNLSMFYAGNPITVQLTIKGNPLIMSKFNMGNFLPHAGGTAIADPNANTKEAYRKQLEARILGLKAPGASGNDFSGGNGSYTSNSMLDSQSYASSPVFAKINIKGPNVDFKTNAEIPGDFTTDVLSDNFYVVFKVSNNIQGHNFTQELELYAHNIFGKFKITK